MKKVIIAVAMASALVACGGDDVDFDVVDRNQTLSAENAKSNARLYAHEVFKGKEFDIRFQSDSTISKSCRYGDGWASGTVTVKGGFPQKVKCQTTGSGKGINGCLSEEEFATKDYRNQDGKCDKTITKMPKLSG